MKRRGESCCLSAGDQNVVIRLELVMMFGIVLSLEFKEYEAMFLLALADVVVRCCIKPLSLLCHVGDVRLWCNYVVDQ